MMGLLEEIGEAEIAVEVERGAWELPCWIVSDSFLSRLLALAQKRTTRFEPTTRDTTGW